MNISQSNKIFSLENIFIFLPSVICIYAGYLIFNYPVDMVINDEIYLLLDIRQNNFILDWNIFTQDKAGTKWPLYKLLFSLSANSGWRHSLFIYSGFISIFIFFITLYYIVKKEKITFSYNILFFYHYFYFLNPLIFIFSIIVYYQKRFLNFFDHFIVTYKCLLFYKK